MLSHCCCCLPLPSSLQLLSLLPSQSLMPPLPLPSSLFALLVVIATALFYAVDVAHLQSSSLLPLPCCPHPLYHLPLIPIAIALIFAYHSCCCHHCPCCCCLPITLVAITIAFCVVFTFTHPPPLLPSCQHSEGGGEDHLNPMGNPTLGPWRQCCNCCHRRCLAVFASCTTGWDGLVQQHAGFQCPVDGVRQQGGAAVNICGAGIVLSTDQQR